MGEKFSMTQYQDHALMNQQNQSQNLLPSYRKPVDPDAGPIASYIARKKSESTACIMEEQAKAAQSALAIYQAETEAMRLRFTQASDIDTHIIRNEHEKRMMEKEERMREEEIKLKQEEVRKTERENEMLFYQIEEAKFSAMTAGLDYRARHKAMKEELGDDF
jgi:hypothetical protein